MTVSRDYQGTAFVFRDDGYFNMTKAAKHFGKRIDNFLANAETKMYMVALAGVLPSSSCNSSNKKLVEVQNGNGKLPHVGTWAHPKLAVFFARWLDVRFAVWCDAMIEDPLEANDYGASVVQHL